MTTTKSYLAGLGMTGIVIGSVLVLLAVGTGLVAFDGARDIGGGRPPLERVVVGKDARSAGGERARLDAPPAPAIAARLPVASPPPAPVDAPGTTRGAPGREHGSSGRAGHGHGGAQARTRDSLCGGALVRDASEDGGGVAADGPRGRWKRRAHGPLGRSGGRAPSALLDRSNGGTPSAVRGGPERRAMGHGRGLGLGRSKRRVEQAVDSGALPAPLPRPREPRRG
jgi:hypothetical protein